jgi:hypothetical protein
MQVPFGLHHKIPTRQAMYVQMQYSGTFAKQLLPWKGNKYCIFQVCVCSLNHPVCKVREPYCIVICGLSVIICVTNSTSSGILLPYMDLWNINKL